MSDFFTSKCHYILDGHEPKPATILEWCEWFSSHDAERVVDLDKVGMSVVSTVFVGFDSMRISTRRKPLLFETAIFAPHGIEMADKYSTWDEAAAGHKEVVRRVRRAMDS